MDYRLEKIINYTFGFFFLFKDQEKDLINSLKNCDKIIFVCEGNICRSPYAEIKLKSLTENKNIAVLSAGLNTIDDKKANESAIINSKKRGVDLDSHLSKDFWRLNLDKSLIIVSEPVQAYKILFKTFNYYIFKNIFILGLFGETKKLVIPDPYGKEDNYFQSVYNMIDNSLVGINNTIKNIFLDNTER